MTADDHLSSRQASASTASVLTDAPAGHDPVAAIEDVAIRSRRSRGGLHRKKRTGPVRNAIEWVLIIGAALLVALLIKQFLIQAFYIPSESMEETLQVSDRVLVNKLSYRLHDVHRGDIVVFKRPTNEAAEPAIKDLIKRVVAVAGDTIESREGIVYLNDRRLREDYLPTGSCGGRVCTANLPRQTVPPDHVFVMGDNRANSRDARVFGAIDEELIIGRAFVRVFPLSKITFL